VSRAGRVKDLGARILNVNIGRDNFDELRFEYFSDDRTVAIRGLQKPDQIDWRTITSPRTGRGLRFPGVKDKARGLLEEFPAQSGD